MCSGAVRLEQCECGPAGERGGDTFVLWHGTRQLDQVVSSSGNVENFSYIFLNIQQLVPTKEFDWIRGIP